MKRLLFALVSGILFLLILALRNNAQNEGEKEVFRREQDVQVRHGDRKTEKKPPSNALKVGDVAPDFTLNSADGKQSVKLSSFKGKKPVMLIFGSYT